MNQLKKQIQVLKKQNDELRQKLNNTNSTLNNAEVNELSKIIDGLGETMINQKSDYDRNITMLKRDNIRLADELHKERLRYCEFKDHIQRVKNKIWNYLDTDEDDDNITDSESDSSDDEDKEQFSIDLSNTDGSISAEYDISNSNSTETDH